MTLGFAEFGSQKGLDEIPSRGQSYGPAADAEDVHAVISGEHFIMKSARLRLSLFHGWDLSGYAIKARDEEAGRRSGARF